LPQQIVNLPTAEMVDCRIVTYLSSGRVAQQ